MNEKKSDIGKNKSYMDNHPSIRGKFKDWIFNKEMIAMKNDKKIDVSKVSGGVLSIEEKDGKFNVVSTKVLDSFGSKEDAQKAINDIAESNWDNHGVFGMPYIPNPGAHHHAPKMPKLIMGPCSHNSEDK